MGVGSAPASPAWTVHDGQSEAEDTALKDTRGEALGLGRLVISAFWVMGVLTVLIAVWDLFSGHDLPLGPRLTTLFAGIVYLAAAVGLTHNGRRMRMLAWTCISVALAGPIIVGLLGVGSTPMVGAWSPWANFGAQAWFVPLGLPVIGFVWLWWSNPRRIVEIAEGIERVTRRPHR